MKKFVCLLAVMALTAPLFAADVDFSGDGAGSTLTLSYVVNAGDSPRGIGLKCTVLDGLVDIDTAGVTQDAAYNANIDYAYTVYTGGGTYNLGDGNPIADPCGAGVLPVDTGVRIFSICMGVLDPCQAPGPAAASPLVSIPMTGSGTATIRIDVYGLRGGVVGSALATNLPITVQVGSDECFPSGHADYDEWLGVGSPDCWCAPPEGSGRQCLGDADGLAAGKKNYWVSGADLDVLVAAWSLPFEDIDGKDLNGTPLICADFDHQPAGKKAYRVSGADLDILVANWSIENGPDIACP